ncbi:MAG: hypothetical protein HQ582_08395, partial [Planctomycetes bacterium]|nr:hypothetical protein [Planctomycetota bacterium]
MRQLTWALACVTGLWFASGALAGQPAPLPERAMWPGYVVAPFGDSLEGSASRPAAEPRSTGMTVASEETLDDPMLLSPFREEADIGVSLPIELISPPVPRGSVLGGYSDAGPPDDGVVRIDPNCAAFGGPYFDVVLESILWRLEHTRGRAVARNPVLGETTFTDDVDLGLSVGTRISTTYLSDESENVAGFEMSYFGVYDWEGEKRLVAPGATFLRLADTLGDPGVTTDFSQADVMRLQYESRINSVELNLIFGEPLASFHMILGPRFMQLEERFNIDSFTGPRWSFYEVTTRDELFGLQVGGRWRRVRAWWELDSFLKIGAYNNKARLTTLMTDNDRTVVMRDYSNGKPVASFVVDAGISVTRRINHRWLVRVGYSILLMDN